MNQMGTIALLVLVALRLVSDYPQIMAALRRAWEINGMDDVKMLLAHAAGAGIGASVAEVFRKEGDPKRKTLRKIIIGTVLGAILSPPVTYYLDLPFRIDFWVGSGVTMGLFIVLALEVFFAKEIRASIISAAASRIKSLGSKE